MNREQLLVLSESSSWLLKCLLKDKPIVGGLETERFLSLPREAWLGALRTFLALSYCSSLLVSTLQKSVNVVVAHVQLLC